MNRSILFPLVIAGWLLPGCGQEPDGPSLFTEVETMVIFDCPADAMEAIDPSDRRSVLARHRAFLASNPTEGELSFLCDADLSNADLTDVDLSRAMMTGANLSHASLGWANLSRSILVDADLRWAVLMDARLNGANLSGADLAGANLAGADLSGADLSYANLSGANLDNAVLTDAQLSGARLSGVTYVPDAQPDAADMAQAKCLHLLKRDDHSHDPRGLVALRNLFEAAGYRKQEREVTYALKRSDFFTLRRSDGQLAGEDPDCVTYATSRRSDRGWLETSVSYLAFDLPTAWGMHPGRALAVLFGLIPVFAIPYAFAARSRGEDGIWRSWSSDRARKDEGSDAPERIEADFPGAFWLGLQFSLISAFHLGWRDLNVGNWISRLQTRDYSLQASGWVRSVAGVQSLISVYLLAMWVLTYFGRPFQ